MKTGFFLIMFLGISGIAVGASVKGVGVSSAYREKVSIREGSRGRRGRAGTLFFIGGRRSVGGGGLRGGK